MFVICYLFVVYALICYIKQKKGDCLFWLFASSTGLGFIDTSTAPVKTSDFLIVATIIILTRTDDWENIGNNMHVMLLSLVYSLLIKIVVDVILAKIKKP